MQVKWLFWAQATNEMKLVRVLQMQLALSYKPNHKFRKYNGIDKSTMNLINYELDRLVKMKLPIKNWLILMVNDFSFESVA